MSDTGEKVTRLLSLVPYVLSQGAASITQTAAEFGIEPDQLRRELEMLWLCGRSSGPEDLIDLMFDGDTVSVTYDGGLSRPFKLSSTEAMTLAIALRTLADIPGAAYGGAAERALAKIETAAGQQLDTAGVDIRLAEQDKWLGLVQRAVSERRAIDLRYYTAGRDAATQRVVDPVQVFAADGLTYLEAWCRSAAGIRIFRLDRIMDAVLLDEPAQVPAEVTPSDVSSGVYRPAPEHLLVELLLQPGWRWVADYYSTETVTELANVELANVELANAAPSSSAPSSSEPSSNEPDSEIEKPAGALRIGLRVADPAWVVALVRRSGGEVEVLAPDWLARSATEEARQALAAYR